ncbi:MAG: hypothetical protein ACJ77M_06625, partial [Thermoleophilaceae bacterium]
GNATRQFFEQMIQLHAFDYVDGFGIHPYSEGDPDAAGSGFLALPYFHDRLVQIGKPNVDIWVTEYGAPTSTVASEYSVPLTGTGQADRLRNAFAIAARWPWIKNLTWYEFQDLCVNPADFTCNFGLVHEDMSPKPAAGALSDVVRGELPRIDSHIALMGVPSSARLRLRRGAQRALTVAGTLDTVAAEETVRPVTLTLSWSRKSGGRAAKTRTLGLSARDGRFSATLRHLRAGYWRAVAAYAGSSDYYGSTSGPLTFAVKKARRR